MDIFSSLVMVTTGWLAASSVITWGAVEAIKRAFFYADDAKDKYLPFVAAGVSLIIGMLTWLYAGDFSPIALIPYILGSIIILGGSEALHSKRQKHLDKKPKPAKSKKKK